MIKETIKNLYPVRSKLSNGINPSLAVIIAALAFLLITLGFFSVFILFRYQKQIPLNACLLKAKKHYDEEWMTTCLSLYSPQVIQRDGADNLCASMAAEHADPVTQNYYAQIDACLTRYPQ